jgi:hypothetical protein
MILLRPHAVFIWTVCRWFLGRDPKTGLVNYDLGKVLQHLATDLKHTPLIVPSDEQGIVFGFRF